jgi:hypothetical protein
MPTVTGSRLPVRPHEPEGKHPHRPEIAPQIESCAVATVDSRKIGRYHVA